MTAIADFTAAANEDRSVSGGHRPIYSSLLVYAGWSPAAEDLVRCAFSLANQFGAKISGISTPALVQGAQLPRHMQARLTLEGLIQANMKRLGERFGELTSSAKHGASWKWRRSPPVDALAGEAHAADLIVVNPSYVWPRPRFPSKMFSSALYLGRPILVIPWSWTKLDASVVVIAWNESAQCRRAIWDAMPFLVRAKRVSLLHYPADLDPCDAQRLLDQAVEALRERGVAADAQVLPRNGGRSSRVLAHAAKGMGAGLIVAGAYGGVGLRRMLTGSTTDDLVKHAGVALLLSR